MRQLCRAGDMVVCKMMEQPLSGSILCPLILGHDKSVAQMSLYGDITPQEPMYRGSYQLACRPCMPHALAQQDVQQS